MKTTPHEMTHAEASAIIEARPLRPDKSRDTTCPACHKGTYTGLFYVCCDNPDCCLYDRFTMGNCGICGVPRRRCSC